MVNQVVFVGNLVKDPEAYETKSNGTIARFCIAVNREKDQVDYFPVITFKGTAKAVMDYLKKGSKVCVIGQMHSRKYEDDKKVSHTVYEVISNQVEFLDTKKKEESKDDLPYDYPNG